MSQKTLSVLAKIIIILFAVLGIAFYGIAVPFGGQELLSGAPELGLFQKETAGVSNIFPLFRLLQRHTFSSAIPCFSC